MPTPTSAKTQKQVAVEVADEKVSVRAQPAARQTAPAAADFFGPPADE
ncbi:MAG: hypothetical protein U5R30_08265 [Deltaproteobacteria bacterium]|nr:hypothetical protein [Deltaproteobacteria bacterium]